MLFQRFSFKPEAHVGYVFGSQQDGCMDIYGQIHPDEVRVALQMQAGLHASCLVCQLLNRRFW